MQNRFTKNHRLFGAGCKTVRRYPDAVMPMQSGNDITSYKQIATTPRRRSLEDTPEGTRNMFAARMLLLFTLTWDYADTVVNIAATLRNPSTKKLSRAIREIYRLYQSEALNNFGREATAQIQHLTELFEELCRSHLDKLCYSIGNDKYIAQLDGNNKMLVKSVQMAMTLIDTMQMFAAEHEEWLRSQGIDDIRCFPIYFRGLRELLPHFAGDKYNPDLDARKLTAKILLNELKMLEVDPQDGKE